MYTNRRYSLPTLMYDYATLCAAGSCTIDTLCDTSSRCWIGSKRRYTSVRGSKMTGNLFRVLFVVVMVAVIVSVDLLFLRHHFTARLIANIGIVLMFVIVYFISFKKS